MPMVYIVSYSSPDADDCYTHETTAGVYSSYEGVRKIWDEFPETFPNDRARIFFMDGKTYYYCQQWILNP